MMLLILRRFEEDAHKTEVEVEDEIESHSEIAYRVVEVLV